MAEIKADAKPKTQMLIETLNTSDKIRIMEEKRKKEQKEKDKKEKNTK